MKLAIINLSRGISPLSLFPWIGISRHFSPPPPPYLFLSSFVFLLLLIRAAGWSILKKESKPVGRSFFSLSLSPFRSFQTKHFYYCWSMISFLPLMDSILLGILPTACGHTDYDYYYSWCSRRKKEACYVETGSIPLQRTLPAVKG